MNLLRISLKLLLSKKQFSSTNISIYFSIISFTFTIIISLLVIGFSRGYKNSIEIQLSNIEPDFIISHIEKKYVSNSFNNLIIDQIDSLIIINYHHANYIRAYAMLKNKKESLGVIIYGLNKEDINNFFQFSDFSYYKDNDDQFLYVSSSLYNKLNINSDNELFIFNIEEMIRSNRIIGVKNKVTGTFKTSISTFDEKIIFLSIEQVKKLLDLNEEEFSGIMFERINSNINRFPTEIINNKDVKLLSWEEKHVNLLQWLTIFSNPIKLILVFILFLSLLYKIFTFWLLLNDKTSSFLDFKILGIRDAIIHKISTLIIIVMSIFSLILGSVVAFIISYIQNKYFFISVDPDIYIISNIPLLINFLDVIYLSIISLVVLIISARIITYSKINQSIISS